MKKIDNQIEWYTQNANSLYDDMVSIELEKINSLYDRYTDHTDEIFVEEMIESFCKIIERQREKIADLENEIDMNGTASSPLNVPAQDNGIPQEGFQDDKQLQDAFTQYCLNKGKSSYTVNDYCSRIKNLWKTFYNDYCEGKLRDNLSSKCPEIPWDGVLMNVYDNTEALSEYIDIKTKESDKNRNWANTRAAFNKFIEFKSHC